MSSVPPDGRRGGWTLATSADLGMAEVDGRRTPGWRLIDSYVGRLFKVAHRDAAVANAYLRVVSMTSAPSSLFHRRIAWRVLTGITTGGEPDPEPSPRAPAGRRATA